MNTGQDLVMGKSVEWDEEYDVVVIGSGFAGLSAAIEARESGAKVVVIEKMRTPGGNSAISGGLLAVADSPLQQQYGISDSPERMCQDMLSAGTGINEQHLARTVTTHSLSALEWTIDHLGVKYKDSLSHLGGHSVPRTYATECGSGSGIIQPMLKKCRELNIPIRVKQRFCHFHLDDSSRVIGVALQEDYHFPHEQDGGRKNIGARQATILATGGFGSDVTFRSTHDSRLGEDVETTNHKGATAEGLLAALDVGATATHLNWIQLGPWVPMDERVWGVGSLFTLLAGFPYGIMVDAKTGQRFVNEMCDRRLRTDAMLLQNRSPVAIVDSLGVRHATTLGKCLKRRVVNEFKSIEDLATFNMIPLDPLLSTVKRFNDNLHCGKDTEYGKPFTSDLNPIQTPPFYSIRLLPKVHYCMGGLRINSNSQVLDQSSKAPIPGLYAAGEVTGGVHGACRLGSSSIVECIIFGRFAGRHSTAKM